MLKKLYRSYRMNFSSGWLTAYCAFCGISFFLRCLYYFVFSNLTELSVWTIISSLILPLMLLFGVIVLFKVIRLDAPGILALIGCGMCLVLILNGFAPSNIGKIIFSLIGYSAGAALLLMTVAGFVPTRQFSVILFVILIGLRILLFRPTGGVVAYILESSDIFVLASLAIMPAAMRVAK